MNTQPPKKRRPSKIKDLDRLNKIQQIRYQLALKRGFISASEDSNWWDTLTNSQKSIIQGDVTKLLITKAQTDMRDGKFEI